MKSLASMPMLSKSDPLAAAGIRGGERAIGERPHRPRQRQPGEGAGRHLARLRCSEMPPWAWSSARSVLPGPPPGWGSPTWSPTCAASPGSRPERHRPDGWWPRTSSAPQPTRPHRPHQRPGRLRIAASNHLSSAVLRGLREARRARSWSAVVHHGPQPTGSNGH